MFIQTRCLKLRSLVLLYLHGYWILYQNDETLEGRRPTCGTTKHCSLRLVQAVTEHLCKPTRITLGNLSYYQSHLPHSLTITNTRHLWVLSSGLINVYTGLNAFYPLSQKLLTVFLTYWHASLNIPVRCLDVEDKAIWYWHSKLTLSFRFTYICIWEENTKFHQWIKSYHLSFLYLAVVTPHWKCSNFLTFFAECSMTSLLSGGRQGVWPTTWVLPGACATSTETNLRQLTI